MKNPHCLNDGVPCASDGAGGCVACDEFAQLLGDTVTEDQPFAGQLLTEDEKTQLFEDSEPCDPVARDRERLRTRCLTDPLPALLRKQAW
jgi:hypothetical protein